MPGAFCSGPKPPSVDRLARPRRPCSLTPPFLTSFALQTSSASASSSTLIPSGLSAGCSTFLTALNSDATLSACVTPLLTATNAAAISSNASSLATSLDALCAAEGCSNTFVRGRLTDFYGNCSAELADEGQTAVRSMYDILFTVVPLKEVVCTKDADSGSYCVSALSANGTAAASSSSTSNGTAAATNGTNVVLSNAAAVQGSSASPAQFAGAHLSVGSLASTFALSAAKRALAPSSAVTTGSDGTYPNATTYRSTNLPYLFIQPSDPASVLCSSCAQAVFTAYAGWETQTTYALGLAESPILGGQADLWAAADSTCGSTWIAGIVNAATDQGATASSVGGSGALSGAGRSAVLSAGAVVLAGAAAAVALVL